MGAKTMAASTAGLVTEQDTEDKSCLTSQVKTKPCGTHAMEMPREHTHTSEYVGMPLFISFSFLSTSLSVCTENTHKMGWRGKLRETLHKDSRRAAQRNKWSGVSCECLLHFPLARHKRPERHAPLRTSAARGASSCTTAPASCRRPGTRTGRRPSRQPTPRAPACRDKRPKSSAWAKSRLTKKKKGTFYYRNISGDEFIFSTVFKLNQKIAAGENYSHYGYILIRKTIGLYVTRQNCNYFATDGNSSRRIRRSSFA